MKAIRRFLQVTDNIFLPVNLTSWLSVLLAGWLPVCRFLSGFYILEDFFERKQLLCSRSAAALMS